MPTLQWFLIENETSYKKAAQHYEQLRDSEKGTPEHKEKVLWL